MKTVLFAAATLVSFNALAFNEGTFPEIDNQSTKSRAEVIAQMRGVDSSSRWVFQGDVLVDNPHYVARAADSVTRQAGSAVDSNLYVG